MKERPIIFSAPMVRAILDGRKTQTRRVVKPQPPHGCSYTINGAGNAALCLHGEGPIDNNTVWVPPTPRSVDHRLPCPYGQPGDRLLVREGFATLDLGDVGRVYYRADGSRPPGGKWRSSLHMPRTVSRITLEIVGARVERLQEISAKDVLAEGAVLRAHDDQFGHNPVSAFDGCVYLDMLSLWARGWDSINAKRAPWESNPWVWVIEFRRVDA